MLDLYHATRAELSALILEQREQLAWAEQQLAARDREIAELRAAVVALTAQVGRLQARLDPDDDGGSGAHAAPMPGLKPTQAPTREPRPRRRRAHGAGRRRMAPTARVVHALAACPDCGARLTGGSVKRRREVIELPPPRIVVTEHLVLERRCPGCGKRCVPAPAWDALVSGQGRLGHGLTSLVAVLREEARLPVRAIQQLLATLTGLQLSVGAIVAASQRLAAQANRELAAIATAIRASPAVHLDETGWRQDGRNGYVWTASTPTQRLFVHGSRARAMVDRLVGADYPGVIVSDFYTAYTNDDRRHQYCWAHLLRDLADLVAAHPDDAAVRGWAEAVGALFARVQATAPGDPATRRRLRRAAQAELAQLCQPWLTPRVAQTVLCRRILTHLPSLFVFVTEPGVPPTNNAAERSLRHLVVARKISGGSRSPTGTATRMALASLFGTWRAQGVNPYHAARDLLASPQL